MYSELNPLATVKYRHKSDQNSIKTSGGEIKKRSRAERGESRGEKRERWRPQHIGVAAGSGMWRCEAGVLCHFSGRGKLVEPGVPLLAHSRAAPVWRRQ